MRTFPLWALALALAFVGPATSGCRRATNSPEYTEAQGLHDRLVADQGDDAYLSPEMDRVEALLREVPDNSLDLEAARALQARIQEERARVRAEAQEAPAEEGAPAPSLDEFEAAAPDEYAQEAAADAGSEPAGPTTGMPLAEFQRRFGSCFTPGQDILVAGVGTRSTYEVRDLPSCQERFAAYRSLVVLIEGNAVGGFAQRQALRMALPDGGPSPEQTQAPAQPVPQPAAAQRPPPVPPTQDPSQVTAPPPPPQDQSSRDYQGIKY